MTREELDRWTLERQMLEELLTRVEQVEHEILRNLGCPTDPVLVFAILNNERPAPWPKRPTSQKLQRLTERKRQRADHAMKTLVLVAKVRQNLGRLNANTNAAAHAALLAGLHAGDGALTAALGINERKKSHQGGDARGKQITAKAAKDDALYATLWRRYRLSEELQDLYPTAVEYVGKELAKKKGGNKRKPSRATIYRHLKALQSQ